MRIAITYQFFLPAFRAGGPIQSIANLAKILAGTGDFEMFIICTDQDLDGTQLDVVSNTWVRYSNHVNVCYCSGSKAAKSVPDLLDEIKPDVIFINGLYSVPFTIKPLMMRTAARRILSARGMLHPGALSQKRLKKRLFITAFKMLRLHKKCAFHATTPEEVTFIKDVFGEGANVWMIPNLPNVVAYRKPVAKEPGSLKMVSISLISPMKNIQQVLAALQGIKGKVTYDIYGPVKDSAYWQKCLAAIDQLSGSIQVNYKGELEPNLVSDVLSEYHVFILPSKSENFGHALFEALSAGRPVITSHTTPWNGLDIARAGYNINPDNLPELTGAVKNAMSLDQEQYNDMTIAAHRYIEEQYDIETIKKEYITMFLDEGNKLN